MRTGVRKRHATKQTTASLINPNGYTSRIAISYCSPLTGCLSLGRLPPEWSFRRLLRSRVCGRITLSRIHTEIRVAYVRIRMASLAAHRKTTHVRALSKFIPATHTPMSPKQTLGPHSLQRTRPIQLPLTPTSPCRSAG
ncbi:unnamed protein product [Ectocarpus fasciculatus]